MELKNGDKLVVRIAFSHSGIEETARALNIPPHQWIQDKLEREVLIMNTVRCVAIPVPRATSLADNLVGKPWMLSEYVEGTSLDTIYALMSWESKVGSYLIFDLLALISRYISRSSFSINLLPCTVLCSIYLAPKKSAV
jgi:hypothetical protein